jgi:hypothetical protein
MDDLLRLSHSASPPGGHRDGSTCPLTYTPVAHALDGPHPAVPHRTGHRRMR